jgi:hypothetical protein
MFFRNQHPIYFPVQNCYQGKAIRNTPSITVSVIVFNVSLSLSESPEKDSGTQTNFLPLPPAVASLAARCR